MDSGLVLATGAATWISAGAAVLAGLTTAVLALVAVLQMRASDRQSAAMEQQAKATRKQAEATAVLADSARRADTRQRLRDAGLPFGIRRDERDMAEALMGIAESLERAYPPKESDGE